MWTQLQYLGSSRELLRSRKLQAPAKLVHSLSYASRTAFFSLECPFSSLHQAWPSSLVFCLKCYAMRRLYLFVNSGSSIHISISREVQPRAQTLDWHVRSRYFTLSVMTLQPGSPLSLRCLNLRADAGKKMPVSYLATDLIPEI